MNTRIVRCTSKVLSLVVLGTTLAAGQGCIISKKKETVEQKPPVVERERVIEKQPADQVIIHEHHE